MSRQYSVLLKQRVRLAQQHLQQHLQQQQQQHKEQQQQQMGSAAVAARMANANHCDYVIPRFHRNTPVRSSVCYLVSMVFSILIRFALDCVWQSCCSTSRSDLSKSSTSLASKTTTWYGTLDSNSASLFIDSSDDDDGGGGGCSDIDALADGGSGVVSDVYERSFDAVERLLDAEAERWCYRDSAVFSDQESADSAVELSHTVAPTVIFFFLVS